MTIAKAFWHDQSGATAIEYAIIGTLVSVLIFGSVAVIGTKISIKFFQPVSNNLN